MESRFFILEISDRNKSDIEKEYRRIEEEHKKSNPLEIEKYAFVAQVLFKNGGIYAVGGKFILGKDAETISKITQKHEA